MKAKAIVPLLLGLGIGLFTVKLAVDTIRKAQASNRPADVVKVVRAKQDIDAFEEIKPENVELVETAENVFVPTLDRIEAIEDLKGRVTSKSIAQNTPVLKSALAPKGTKPGIVGRIPPGYRAVSVKIDEVTSAGYQTMAGSWVDVLVVMDVPTAVRGKKETIAEVILQHVQVAAIGFAMEESVEPTGAKKVKPARSATLLVAEEDVPKLHLAATRGKLTLALRGDDSQIVDQPAAASLADLSSSGEPQPASAVKPAPSWIDAMGTYLASAKTTHREEPRFEPLEEPEPHTVLVYRGVAGAGTKTSVERITYEEKGSAKIIDVSVGPPTRASATMGVSRNRNRSSAYPRPNQGRSQERGTRSDAEKDEEPQPSDGE